VSRLRFARGHGRPRINDSERNELKFRIAAREKHLDDHSSRARTKVHEIHNLGGGNSPGLKTTGTFEEWQQDRRELSATVPIQNGERGRQCNRGRLRDTSAVAGRRGIQCKPVIRVRSEGDRVLVLYLREFDPAEHLDWGAVCVISEWKPHRLRDAGQIRHHKNVIGLALPQEREDMPVRRI
jgi:hypothetical protein